MFSSPDLSICIVSYQAKGYLQKCLYSILENTLNERIEIIVVDNGSSDGTSEMLCQEFPQVCVLRNEQNLGYTRPMNQALRVSRGRYLVQLNPDTLLLPAALDTLFEFMETNTQVGICGPKVLNPDRTLQKPCRRGDSRPWAVISYFSRLYALFPKSKFFGGYLLNYMDEDEIYPVDGVSGSCMMIRREVIEQVGYLDELFFAYQEDSDYCLQTRRAGWQVFYVPSARIIHHGGRGGSRVQPYRSIFEWHRSYWRYYRKNFASEYPLIFNSLYYLLIGVKLAYALAIFPFMKDKFASQEK